MIAGAIRAPNAEPLLKIPLPKARSAGGNMLATTRRAQGKLKASPTPSAARVAASVRQLPTKAAAAPATDQNPTARARTIRIENRSAMKPAGICRMAYDHRKADKRRPNCSLESSNSSLIIGPQSEMV